MIPLTLWAAVAWSETGFANAVVATYPAVMIGAFGVPLAILLHVVSLRELVRKGRASAR